LDSSQKDAVCVHELAHACEILPDGQVFTESREWTKAWRLEIDQPHSPLNQYAKTNPSEGFAEFFRYYAGNPESARKQFPQSAVAVERVYGRL
jgi:hypothetical protein